MDCHLDRRNDAWSETFVTAVRRNPINAALLDRLPALGLPDAWLVAGCLVQTFWNIRSGRPPEEGIRDYDIFYCDTADLSWDAEDHHIRRVAAAVADLPAQVELRNQARVHLWYGERFGAGYPPLHSSREAIGLFLIDCTRVALQAAPGAAPHLYAPCDRDDLCAGVLRPNWLNHRPELFTAKAASYCARWPWLRIEGTANDKNNV
jgi:hypothetical protein